MKVVFFGTPYFAEKILFHLLEKGVNIVGIVTMPDRPQGRSKTPVPSPVKVLWLEKNLSIPLIQEEKASSEEGIKKIAALDPDLFIVVGFGEILKPPLLALPKKGAINIHTSLLPKYRGAAPIQRAIMAGETHMGITIIKMNPVMDAGEMLARVGADIPKEWDFPVIEEKLIALAKEEIIKVIHQVKEGKIAMISQDISEITLAPKILPEDTLIDWHKPAEEIVDLIRALTPKPCASASLLLGDETKRVKIYKAHLASIEEGAASPGEVVEWTKEKCLVKAGNGAVSLLELQMEGRSRILAKELFAGYFGKKLRFI